MVLNLLYDHFLLVSICFGVVLRYLVKRHRSSRFGKPLPMPRGLPILGNILQVGRMPWYRMTEWSKSLGPVYRLNLGGRSVIVLNSHQVAADILDKKSGATSDRPRMIMASEILCGGHAFALSVYNDQCRKFRKLANEALGTRTAGTYDIYQEREARILVRALMEDDVNWSDHLHRAIASSTIAVSYGLPSIKDCNDTAVSSIYGFMRRVENAARPGTYLVDIFPWLNYLPNFLAKWKREGTKMHEKDTAFFEKLLRDSIKGSDGPCVSTFLAPRIESGEVSEKEAAWLSGVLFGAGSSTTSGTHHVFALAMLLHPNVMRKAQTEVDSIVGRYRLPNANDRNKLVYCRAVMREVIRWRYVAPLGLSHWLDRDEEYNGYHLPKDSIILFNEWAMNNDDAVYGDPENFRPERFLDGTETMERVPPNTHGEGHTGFGYGRRKCVGITVATNTLLLNIATLLWAFDIVKARDGRGDEISPDPNAIHEEGILAIPEHFPCRFVPREPEQLVEILGQSRKTEQGQ